MKEKQAARQAAIEDAVTKLLRTMDIDLRAEPYRETPRRVATMILELVSGMDKKNEPKLTLFKNEGYKDILILGDIPFYSLCAHQMHSVENCDCLKVCTASIVEICQIDLPC
jgi:GTP cyclohydrolase I